MLSSYFKAAKSRRQSVTTRLSDTDSDSKMEAQPVTNTTTTTPRSAVDKQIATNDQTALASNSEQSSAMDTETEATPTASPSCITHQTVADGRLASTSSLEPANEIVLSPQASSLPAEGTEDSEKAMAMGTNAPGSNVISTAPGDAAGDKDVRSEQHLTERDGASEEVVGAQFENNEGPMRAKMLATETSTRISELPATSGNMPSADDMVLPVANLTSKDTYEATAMSKNLDNNACLCRYRLSADAPSLRGRAKSVPATCGRHYTIMSSWPPQEAPPCDFGKRLDVFPPKDAPLHVWIQAYALRWGVWSAEVKDDAKRAQLLDVVAEKMKAAWETAIIEGYYVRPREAIVDMTYARAEGDGQDGQDKRGRKRAPSTSRLPAGFTHEGRDPFAVTNGELAQNRITIEMIKTRVQNNNYEASELLLDDVLGGLPDGRERLVERDWSATYHPSIRGRNLLMYSLWVVQDARVNVTKLSKLMKHFTKEQQRKNTQSRIEMYQEREAQHLALAAELQLRQSDEQDADDKDKIEPDPVDLTSETGSDEPASTDGLSAPIQGSTEANIIDLAREVMTANDEQRLLECFTTRKLRKNDFMPGGILSVDVNDKLKAAAANLGNIYQDIEHVVRFRSSMKGQQPSEMIRMGHDARLIKNQVDSARRRLCQILQDDLPCRDIDILETGVATSNNNDNEPAGNTEFNQEAQDFSMEVDNGQGQSVPGTNVLSDSRSHPQDAADSPTDGTRRGLGGSTNPSAQAQAISAHSTMTPTSEMMPLPTTASLQQPLLAPTPVLVSAQTPPTPLGSNISSLQTQADLKQSYINEQWIPFLRKALADQGLPPINGAISLWPQIKDVLTQIGFTSEERNEQLRRFKKGFSAYVECKGLAGSSNRPSQSPTPSVPAQSPALSHAPLQPSAPPSWPSDEEILAAIPNQGIHGSNLIQHFDKRIGHYRPQFIQTVQRLAVISPQQVVYPRHLIPSTSRQYDTLPPLQARAPAQQSQHISPPSHMLSPSPAPPGVLKLKYSPHHSTTPALLPQDESQMPEEFKSTGVEGSRGFFFRHLPHATLGQRKRMDDHVGEYISEKCKSRRKNYLGQYITFKDPIDPAGPVILHGFWNNRDGSQPEGSGWFFNGEDVPAGWDTEQGAHVGADESAYDSQYNKGSADQTQPKLKLKLIPPPQDANSISAGRRNAQAAQDLDPYAHYGATPTPPQISPSMPRGRGRSSYLPSHGMGSIDPAQLSKPYAQPDVNSGSGQAGKGQMHVGKRGTKRDGSEGRGGGKTKRRKNNIEFEDQDDSGDYDPNQDF